eukprot:jgi/Ulvmu1/7720/UM039_0026.1
MEELRASVATLLRFRSNANVAATREVADSLSPVTQDSKPGRDLALSAARHLLTTYQPRKGESELKLGIAEIYFHAIRLDAIYADTDDADVLTDIEMKDMYNHLIQNFRILKQELVQKIAENHFFVPLLDVDAPELLKGLFKAVIKVACEFQTGDYARLDSDETDAPSQPQRFVQSLLSICVTVLRQADDTIDPALDCIVEQLCSLSCADNSCSASRFICNVLRQSEDAVGMALQTRVQNMIAFESATPQRTLAKGSSVPTLLQNLTIAVPKSMAALTPQISPLLDTGSEREAVMAADLLQMQLNSVSMPVGMRMDILSRLLASVASGSEPVRLRIAAALPEIALAAEQLPVSAGGPSRVAEALLQRLLDPAVGVRVAAVRGLGELCSRADGELPLGLDDRIEANTRTKMLNGIVGRLRDCVFDVREAALKAALPAFADFVRDASNLHASEADASILDGPSDGVKAVVHLLTEIVRVLAMQDNLKIFAMAPSSAPALAFLPSTDNTAFDAAVLVCLLTHPIGAPLVKRLMEWQNRLRMLLLDLFAVRRDISKALQSDRQAATDRADTIMCTIVAHYCQLMPKGSLTVSTLQSLTGQRDNKLFDSLQAVCCTPTAGPFYPPVFGGRKRGPGHTSSQTQSQRSAGGRDADAASPTPASAREDQMVDLLGELRQRMRARSREVVSLVRAAAVDYITPASVLALLDMLSSVPDVPTGQERHAAIRVIGVVSIIQVASPLMLRSTSQDVLHLVFHGTAPQAATALQLAAAAHKRTQTTPMTAADRESVVSRLTTMAFEGPVAYAPPIIRAAHALLPAAAHTPFVQRLSAAAEDALQRRACDAEAVNAAHVMTQLVRDAPSLVAEHAVDLVAWVMDTLLPSDAVQHAADRGCLEHLLDLSLNVEAWLAAPARIHHTCALMSSLSKALIDGYTSAAPGDRPHLHEAVTGLVQRLVPLLATDADYDVYGSVSDDDAALLRLTAALCLMRVGTCADHLMPPYAYVELALVMHDGSADVRRVFGTKLRSEMSKAIAALDPKDPHPPRPHIAKYIAILCFAATEPVHAHRNNMLKALTTLCATWQERAAATVGGVAEAESHGTSAAQVGASENLQQNRLVHRPEYSVFFVIYLVAHHEDFPLEALCNEATDGGDEADADGCGIRQFERMVGFHVGALIRAAPSAAQSLCLVQTFARIASRLTEDAEDDAERSYTRSEQLAADLVVHTARGLAGPDTVKEASQLIAPKSITIHTKLYQAKSNPHSKDRPLQLPKWYSFEDLPRDFRKLLHKEAAADEQTTKAGPARQNGKPGGKKGKSRTAKKVTPKPTTAKKVAQPKARSKLLSSGMPASDLAGPGSQTRLQPVRMQALPDSESPARKQPARNARQARRELRSLSLGCSGAAPVGDTGSPQRDARIRRQLYQAGADAQPTGSSACSGDAAAGGAHSPASEPVSMLGGTGKRAKGVQPRQEEDDAPKETSSFPQNKQTGAGVDVAADGKAPAVHVTAGPASKCNDCSKSSGAESDVSSDAVSPGQENEPGNEMKSRRRTSSPEGKASVRNQEVSDRPAKQLRAS